jgi:hypothetical protein
VVLVARDRTLFEAHADRQLKATAIEVGESGLVLEARVEDFSCTWRPEESNAEVPLRLALLLAGDSQEQQDIAPVKLDAQPPVIRYFGNADPGANVPAGRLAVQLIAIDQWSGVAKVEVARNVDPRAPFGEGDQQPELSGVDSDWDPATGQLHWQAVLPADLAKPGETVRLVARVFDGVGHESPVVAAEITAPSPTAAAEPLGTILGEVSFSGRPEKEIVVELKGPNGTRTAKLDSNNRYVFRNVPAGTYSVRVEANVVFQVAGQKKVGDESGELTFDPKTNKSLSVDLNLEEIR